MKHKFCVCKKKANKKEILFGEHGVYTKDMEIDKSVDNIPYIPVSANSLISLLSNPSFNFVNTLEQSGKVQNQAFIYYGNKDEYQTWPVEKYEHIFINHFKDAYFFIHYFLIFFFTIFYAKKLFFFIL